MTSTTDTAQHPDVSEISELAEGLLSPSRTADIRRHLDGCPLCADVHDSLAEIKELLGTLPGPPRMPAEIAGRIDAALAAEALLDSAATRETAPIDTALEKTGHVSRETTPVPQTSAPAATAEAVRADRPASRPRAATGPGRPGSMRRRRRIAVLGAVFGTAAVGVSLLVLQSLQASNDSGTSKQATSEVDSSAGAGEEFSEARLQGRVDALLASDLSAGESKTQREDDSSSDRSMSNAPLLEPEPEVPSCVQQGTGRTEAALAAEQGMYRGSRAYLVVLPHPADSTRVEAYVIDATCVDSAPSSKGKLLLTHSYPRH